MFLNNLAFRNVPSSYDLIMLHSVQPFEQGSIHIQHTANFQIDLDFGEISVNEWSKNIKQIVFHITLYYPALEV